ncbi:HU family DNA-binding protein [Nocardiopsis sp. CNT-189]
MNKNDIIDSVAESTGTSRVQVGKTLDAFFEKVSDSLKHGDPVTLIGFGTFSVAVRSARSGRNPKTGEAMEIPETKVPVFKAGKTLKDAVS